MRQSWGRLLTWRVAVMLLVAIAALVGFYLLVSPGAQSKNVGALAQYVPGPPGPPPDGPPGRGGGGANVDARCAKAKQKVAKAREQLREADTPQEQERAERKLERAKKKKQKACAKT